MAYLSLPMLEELAKDFYQTQLLICGEVHGVQQNYDIYGQLIDLLAIKQVGVELENDTFHFLIDSPLNKNTLKKLQELHWPDGRINSSFINLLKKLAAKDIDIFFFDKGTEEYYRQHPTENDARDRIMAEEIKKYKDPQTPTLIWAGNYHTRPYRTRHNHKSMIAFLHEMNIPYTLLTLEYGEGTYYNFGVKTFYTKHTFQKLSLHKEKNSYSLYLPKVKAADIEHFENDYT